MKRRDFIKLSLTAGFGAAVPPVFLGAYPFRDSLAVEPPGGKISVSPTVCNMCFWKCSGFVHKKGETLWKIIGNQDDLHCQGRLCTRGTGGIGAYTDPDRLTTPMMRVEVNGQQTFKPVSWDEALSYISERLTALKDKHGADRVAMFTHGDGAAHFRHLLKAFGSDSDSHPSYAQCRGPRDMGFELTFGEGVGSPDRTDMSNARCIVLIGSHIGENLHNAQVQTFTRALENGATVITVDPRFSVAASKSQHWLPIKPGTDIALLLAWMNVLINEDLFDRDYVAQYTTGFDELSSYIQPFTPEWAYTETGIDPDTIRTTARAMGQASPATVVHPGRHVTWYGDDTQRSRAIAILNALLGSWGRKGGFYQPERVKLPKFPVPPYPKAKSSWRDFTQTKYPLAHHAVTNTIIDASRGEDAHYKGWIVYGTNLPMTIPGIRGELQEAIDQQELVVVIDVQPAEITGYADIILPECTYLERFDPIRNSPERAPSLALRAPAMEPLGDSKPGWWIAKQLGERLGLSEYFPWNDYSEVLDWQLQQVGSSLEEMQELGHKRFPRTTPLYFAKGEARRFRTPSGKIELSSPTLASHGFDPMPAYTPPDPVPDGYLRLNYGRVAAHTFGRTQNNPLLYELAPENVVWINPLIASEKQIRSGDYVRLQNPDGITSNRVRVRVTERIRPDSVYLPHGFGHTDKRLSLAYGKGADGSALMTRPAIDPVMGGTGMRTNFVTILTEEA